MKCPNGHYDAEMSEEMERRGILYVKCSCKKCGKMWSMKIAGVTTEGPLVVEESDAKNL